VKKRSKAASMGSGGPGPREGNKPIDPKVQAALKVLLAEMFQGADLDGGAVNLIPQTVMIQETEEQVIVRLQVRGLLREELRLRFSNNHLLVDFYEFDPERQTIIDPTKINWDQMKKIQSQKIPLPMSVVEHGARARFNEGVLTVYLTKKAAQPETRLREIPLE